MVAGRKHKLRDKQSDTEPSPQQTQPRPCHRCSDYRRCFRFRTCLITRYSECVLAAESTHLKAVRDRKALPKQSKRQDTTNLQARPILVAATTTTSRRFRPTCAAQIA
jgi:hypothetical protein